MDNCVKHELPQGHTSTDDSASLVAATEIIRRLRSHGHAAYICGGWVRDRFMQRCSPDIDVATSASSMQVQKLFRNVRVLPRNTVRVPVMNELFEVTTFRGYQRDNDLLSVQLDAEARDFTMNALYYDPLSGDVLDFVGGVRDIQARVLAGCGAPADRLREDPVRVLRAVRFVVAFQFKLEPTTAAALKEVAHMCCPEQGVSGQRLWREFVKMAYNDQSLPGSFIRGLRLSFQLGLLQHLLPFIANDAVLQQALEAQQRLPPGLPVELRIAALLPPSSKLSDYLQLSSRFKVGEAEAARIDLLARLADLSKQQSPDPQAWVQFYGSPQSQECLDVMLAWLPEVWRAPFQQFHSEKQATLAPDIQVMRSCHQPRQQQVEQAATTPRTRTVPRDKTLGELLPAHVLQGLQARSKAAGGEAMLMGSPLTPTNHGPHPPGPVPLHIFDPSIPSTAPLDTTAQAVGSATDPSPAPAGSTQAADPPQELASSSGRSEPVDQLDPSRPIVQGLTPGGATRAAVVPGDVGSTGARLEGLGEVGGPCPIDTDWLPVREGGRQRQADVEFNGHVRKRGGWARGGGA